MKLSDFDFTLPDDLIATAPMEPREAAKLLHVKAGRWDDKLVGDIPLLLKSNDLLIFNDTKVIPARLFGKRGEAKVEVLLHKRIFNSSLESQEGYSRDDRETWECFAKPGKRAKVGDVISFAGDFEAEVLAKHDSGAITLAFNVGGASFHEKLAQHGSMPLPPYIAKKRAANKQDEQDYQTIFAQKEGAVAAPTAGLHFTPNIMQQLERAGVRHAFVTLHVGAGTFLPVKVDDVTDHQMHSEYYEMSEQTAALIAKAKAAGGRVIPVGTTSMRVLESVADEAGEVAAGVGETNIFITPGYRFKLCDALFTNFHTPCSTLFMLVCALAGYKTMRAAYAHAIKQRYRFYSYGDTCLLEL